MNDKVRKIFELMGIAIKKSGCDSAMINLENYSGGVFDSGREYYCNPSGNHSIKRLPFDVTNILNEWWEENDYSLDNLEDNVFGGELHLFPDERKIIIKGNYTVYENRDEQEFERSFQGKNEPAFAKLKSEGIQSFDVDFHGGGDSGYIEDNGFNVESTSGNLSNIDTNQYSGLDDLMYDMLSTFGGWEIDGGSQGSFHIDVENEEITLTFSWNEERVESEELYTINY